MKALAWLSWTVAALLGIAAFPIFIAACWAHGDNASRFAGTGFVTALAALILAALGAAAHEAA